MKFRTGGPESSKTPPPLLRKMGSSLIVLLGAVLLALLWVVPAYAADGVLTPEARRIALKVQCPICPGESIAESHSDVARNMRIKLQELVDEGRGEQEILDYFAERYGVGILRDPPKEGIALGVWIVPPLALLGGLGLLVAVLRSWRRQRSQEAQEEDGGGEELAEMEEDVRRWQGRAR